MILASLVRQLLKYSKTIFFVSSKAQRITSPGGTKAKFFPKKERENVSKLLVSVPNEVDPQIVTIVKIVVLLEFIFKLPFFSSVLCRTDSKTFSNSPFYLFQRRLCENFGITQRPMISPVRVLNISKLYIKQ